MKKRIAVVNDVSGLGNCSMAVNLPVLSVMGLEACPIPTSILTNQSCYNVSLSQQCNINFQDYKTAWDASKAVLGGIYSGYFPGGESVNDFIQSFLGENHPIYVNDPVMGDLGEPYSNCDTAMIKAMQKAVTHAFVTTPNLTELCLLSGTPLHTLNECATTEETMDVVEKMACSLISSGTKNVVVTGIKGGFIDGKATQLYNVLATNGGIKTIVCPLLSGDFSGTGDIFSSIVAGSVFLENSIEEGTEKAILFIEKAINYTNEHRSDCPNDGIYYQGFLSQLVQ